MPDWMTLSIWLYLSDTVALHRTSEICLCMVTSKNCVETLNFLR